MGVATLNTLSGKLVKTAGVLGLAVAALATVSASPAGASASATASCTKYYRFDNVQVQVDNCSDGWVWIYTGDGTYYTATVEISVGFGGGETKKLTADRGKATAQKFIQVGSIKICGTKWLGIPYASPWWTYCTADISV